MAWALSQIIVTSANEPDLSYAHVMSRFQNIMFQEAFGNYETLLLKVTYNPAMGNYLDMVNNDRPAGTRVPNENYAREIMQLFSVGLYELNADGTPILDAQNQPVPTYDQAEIAEFARVFTGYTYASAANPAGPAAGKQGRYYGANLVPYPTTATTGHDPNAKTLLNGTVLPAGQTGKQDIDAAVRNVFMHPNTGPFVAQAADPAARDRQSVEGLCRPRRRRVQQQRQQRPRRPRGGRAGDPARRRGAGRNQDGG